MMMSYECVVMGASAGGLEAFTEVLSPLPASFPLPIVIVQHLLEHDDSYLAVHLDRVCQLKAIEAVDKERIKPGVIYTSPPGYHMLIENNKTISLSAEPPVNYSRPSIDLLFESAANTYRDKLICILMTGANNDGSKGMSCVHNLNGICIVQDPATASASMMPASAIEATQVDYIMTFKQISDWLCQLGDINE